MKKFMTLVILLQITILFSQEKAQNFITSIEKAHHKDVFMSQKYLRYSIDIVFGGQQHLKGTITQEPGGGKIKIEKEDGSKIIFNGKEVFALGIRDSDMATARFDIFTWAYFLGLPYKLNDEGTIWSDFNENKWGSKKIPTGKLTFKAGTGDAPDDWYIIYKNPKNNMLNGAAYIVTFGKGKKKAEEEPHAIKYNDFQLINTIPIATHWTFHLWSLKEGYQKIIGEVKLSNISFIDTANFEIPEKAQKVNTIEVE
ncbi:DUF6503 family protein [Tenacibaculum sp. TC6]|uniref:DUF6503 family protein n=1 Tax=Tenacibaculum sp. TC6 TaxID=3423223 RepID=UPI003D363A4F